ncbi:MAG: hypothetical protein MZV70_11090 [Desulfobacterales bacterium]|nr:hypothetical protein [Desulfobacterales bacterium]
MIPAAYSSIVKPKRPSWSVFPIIVAPETEVVSIIEPQPEVQEDVQEEVQEEVVILDEVIIKNIEERPQFKAFEAVDNGDYLEITTEHEASNRVVEVSTGVLPKLINPDNTFVMLEKTKSLNSKNSILIWQRIIVSLRVVTPIRATSWKSMAIPNPSKTSFMSSVGSRRPARRSSLGSH